jgi:hypothetical protein
MSSLNGFTTKLSDKEQSAIRLIVDNSSKFSNVELEWRYGIPLEKFGGETNKIDYATFMRVLESCRRDKKLKLVQPTTSAFDYSTSLDITVSQSQGINRKDNLSDLRFTINGLNNVSEFCRTNKLPADYELIYKGKMFFLEEEKAKIVENPEEYSLLNKDLPVVLDLESYNIRLGSKLEIPYSRQDKRFNITNLENPLLVEEQRKATEAYQAYQKLLENNGKKFENLYKTFRLKNRFKFEYKLSDDQSCYIDLTIVKSSKKKPGVIGGYDQSVPVKLFMDSGLVESEKEYEIEIEMPNNIKQLDLEDLFFDEIRFILADIENVSFVTNNIIAKDVRFLYKKLIKKLLGEQIHSKQEALEVVRMVLENKEKLDNGTMTKEEYDDEMVVVEEQYPKSRFSYLHNFLEANLNISEYETKYTKQLEDINEERGYYSNNSAYYLGPQVVSLEMNDIRVENPNSIRYDYTVTDKADGVGYILFIVGLSDFSDDPEIDVEKYKYLEGYGYFIDKNLRVFISDYSVDFRESNNSIIFNGEFITHDKEGRNLKTKRYAIYDMYWNGKYIGNYPLMSIKEGEINRYQLIQETLDTIEPKENSIVVIRKQFYIATPGEDIFKLSKNIWEEYKGGSYQYPYKLDGLIYTPAKLPVGFTDTNIDYDLRINITWPSNLKWKPPEDNTIDFLVKFRKETVATSGDRTLEKPMKRTKPRNMGGLESYEDYNIIDLYNGGNELATKLEQCGTPAKGFISAGRPTRGKYMPILFQPSIPLDEGAHEAHLFLKSGKPGEQPKILDSMGMPLEDDTIVEFAYMNFDPNEPNYQETKYERWVPLRTRYDKTFQYRKGKQEQLRIYYTIKNILELIAKRTPEVKLPPEVVKALDRLEPYLRKVGVLSDTDRGISLYRAIERNSKRIEGIFAQPEDIQVEINYGNPKQIAEHIWTTIHNPVSVEMITTGEGIPSINEMEDNYYNRNINIQRDKSLTITMQEFHNKFIKNRLLLRSVSNYLKMKEGVKRLQLLDLGCGKGGDIPKWRDNGIDVCVGIDLFANNIEDPNDGACVRYDGYKERNRGIMGFNKIPDCYFLVGDCGKDINTGEAFGDSRYREQFNSLWNPSVKYDTNFKENRFQIISIMFAIHYFFKNKITLDNIINNIDNNLDSGGFFIGCMFDGQEIFKLLEPLAKGDAVAGYKASKMIWKIIKNYGRVDFPDNEESLGVPIQVLISSINTILVEYLVNFQYLKNELAKRGIRECTVEEVRELGLSNDIMSGGTSSGTFDLVEKYLGKLSYDDPDINLARKIRNEMNEDEKKISFLNRFFIFRKSNSKDAFVERVYEFITKNSDKKDIRTLLGSKNYEGLLPKVKEMMGLPDIPLYVWTIVTDRLSREPLRVGDTTIVPLVEETGEVLPTVLTKLKPKIKIAVKKPKEETKAEPIEKPKGEVKEEEKKLPKVKIGKKEVIEPIGEETMKGLIDKYGILKMKLEKEDSNDPKSKKFNSKTKNKEKYDKLVAYLEKYIELYGKLIARDTTGQIDKIIKEFKTKLDELYSRE